MDEEVNQDKNGEANGMNLEVEKEYRAHNLICRYSTDRTLNTLFPARYYA